ncbi:MAG: hypothetical protein HY899_05140 [Deltaproteobacteria bacterium]|nr:hypothetical protein [Deltaproteobacteria bacterium]
MSEAVHDQAAVDLRRARRRCREAAAAVSAIALLCHLACAASAASADEPGKPQLPPSMLLFGDEHDPERPVAPVPQPTGRGIVAAKLVVAGDAQVLEYDGDAKDTTAIVVDVRLEPGSTTPDFTAASVHARRGGAQAAGPAEVALLAACVLSKDAAVTVTVAAGTRRATWTVHIGDSEFLCAESSTRLALLAASGSFRLSAKTTGDAGARLLLLFAAPAAELSAVEFPGATIPVEAVSQPRAARAEAD